MPGMKAIHMPALKLCIRVQITPVPTGSMAMRPGSRIPSLLIEIPASVTEIEYGAFSECKQLTFIVERDSYAAGYCKENGLKYIYPDAND